MSEDQIDDKLDRSPTPLRFHKLESSNSSILSRFPFMHSSSEKDAKEEAAAPTPIRSLATTTQQYKTRRRRGSLRKVALLGRGAQRDRRDNRPLTIDTGHATEIFTSKSDGLKSNTSTVEHNALGLNVSGLDSRGSPDDFGASSIIPSPLPERIPEQLHNYNSTTDEEDIVQIGSHSATPSRSGLSLSSGSDSYYGNHPTAQRHRPFQQAKSPLSFSGISTTALPPPDSDWDYSETEWWGWVVLTVTWCIFVIGMGSCLDVWSWAWDVGTTPYAPPELEDDPTLPIVGYYPALIILTCVMAWVWVVVAWVGMKYFRHAKISGD
ncbi:hypothetical protein PT974_06587 [Cladobotryum mycophilum]|uniref:PIG-P domain-containing protein n=1 Tax=Cladobotryum mycophilum TaxID=491253 RepID=A0ABR0SLX6_9HYPO